MTHAPSLKDSLTMSRMCFTAPYSILMLADIITSSVVLILAHTQGWQGRSYRQLAPCLIPNTYWKQSYCVRHRVESLLLCGNVVDVLCATRPQYVHNSA